MHGGLNPDDLKEYYNKQHERAMQAPIENIEQRARKAGM